jgi:CubicO group peptidase (beta-lactamase class C family)
VPSRLIALSIVLCLAGSVLAGQGASTAVKPHSEAQGHIDKVVACLPPPVVVKGASTECRALTTRMAELHVPGVSIAVVHNGAIEWARGYGVKQLGGPAVTPETLFQAGSISKPIAALGALHLVQEGKLSLDSDVNATLTTWKIPASPAAPGATVTLKELLTHSGIHRARIPRLCGERCHSNAGSGAEWRNASKHSSYSA